VVVNVRGLRSCGRAPAQSILHASWIQDVAECRIARSRPRSDMEASTISYLRAALIERGTEAKRGGAAINSRAGLNERQAEEKRRGAAEAKRRGAAADPLEVRRRIRPGRGDESARRLEGVRSERAGARAGFGHWKVDGARPISRVKAAENAAGEEYPRRSETCVIEWELS